MRDKDGEISSQSGKEHRLTEGGTDSSYDNMAHVFFLGDDDSQGLSRSSTDSVDSSATSHDEISVPESIPLVDDPNTKFAFKTWSDIQKYESYQSTRTELLEGFFTDEKFHKRIVDSSRAFCETKLHPEVKALWLKIRGDGKARPNAFQEELMGYVLGIGQRYLLDTGALLAFLGKTDFNTIFYKNPLGSVMVKVLEDVNSQLQMRERDFDSLGEVSKPRSGSSDEVETLMPRHYQELDACLRILDDLRNPPTPRGNGTHLDETFALNFDGKRVVIPISVRGMSFEAKSYNTEKGVEALARHITEGVERVCFLLVDAPHVSSDLQVELIKELAAYVDLPEVGKTPDALAQILSKYFEMDPVTNKPIYRHAGSKRGLQKRRLPIVNTRGKLYIDILAQNNKHGSEWRKKYLPVLANTFKNVHFKTVAHDIVFEPHIAAELAGLADQSIPNYKSYLRSMIELLAGKDEQVSQVGTFLVSSMRIGRKRDLVARTSDDSTKQLNIIAYLILACDFIMQAGLASRVGELVGYANYAKKDMVDVLKRSINQYHKLLTQIGSEHPGSEHPMPLVTPAREIVDKFVREGRDDVDEYILRVCEVGKGVENPELVDTGVSP